MPIYKPLHSVHGDLYRAGRVVAGVRRFVGPSREGQVFDLLTRRSSGHPGTRSGQVSRHALITLPWELAVLAAGQRLVRRRG
jgi:hypothetical protein